MPQEKRYTIQHPKSKHYLVRVKNPKKYEPRYEWTNDCGDATEFNWYKAKDIAIDYFRYDPQFQPSDMIIKETIF